MKLTVLGCGDAFGSGGRLQTAYHLSAPGGAGGGAMLIDCGATTLIGLDRAGLDANGIGTILISHLHGDHFSGLVWFTLHALHVARRKVPLVIAGPPGLERRYREASEALFPGALAQPIPYNLSFLEMSAGRRDAIGWCHVTPFEVSHPSGAPSHALRIEAEARVVAFSGDTEWVESLVPCGGGADLFICECYAFERATRYHMRWQTLAGQLPRLGARRIMLTHMSGEMLANAAVAEAAGMVLAQDGMVLEI